MILLKNFINTIHDAILAANDTLTDAHSGILERFFEEEIISDPDQESKTLLKAKHITLNYPQITEQGVIRHDIKVPLLALAPINCPTIDKVEFNSKFTIETNNGELNLNFNKLNESETSEASLRAGEIRITVTPQETPEGLKTLIDGYEKHLKSQMS